MVILNYGIFDYFNANNGRIPIQKFTWRNVNNVSVSVINYGATIVSISYPDKVGHVEDIVMGYDNLTGYLNGNNPYFGATIGRMANRIAYGRINLQGHTIQLNSNLPPHQLHGGFVGFDKVIWDYYVDGNRLILSHLSPDNHEGYPGNVLAHAIFELTDDNRFLIEYKATSSKPTAVNMTSHSYFNLAGHDRGSSELYKHLIAINADRITEVSKEASIPSGNLLPVSGTVFDLQINKCVGDAINQMKDAEGFDHNFCITKGIDQENAFIARVVHPGTGRVLEIYSNQPGVQFYTSNSLPPYPDRSITGKGIYNRHGALCLETQNWPDAPNHDNFPNSILLPGSIYHSKTYYKFSVKEDY